MYKNIKKIPKGVKKKITEIPKKGDYVKLETSGEFAIVKVLSNPDFHSYNIVPRYRCRLIYMTENYTFGYYLRQTPEILKLHLFYGIDEWDEVITKIKKEDIFMEIL